MNVFNSLLRSRKFWIAIFGIVQTLVFQYTELPDEVWQSIAALCMTLIGAIAIEDSAEKLNKSDKPYAVIEE